MNFVESLTYEQLSQLAGCSSSALRKRVSRYGLTKAEALSQCTGVDVGTIESVTDLEQLEKLFDTKIDMERRFTRASGVTRASSPGFGVKPIKKADVTGLDTLIDTIPPDSDLPVTSPIVPKVEQVTLQDKLEQPAKQAVTLIKSDILAVSAMLVLSVLIAVSFTAKIFIASGVSPAASYIMSVLLDFTMIVFVFRGHTTIAWLFGLNIFAQVALTTSARMFLEFMSEATIIGIKGLLVAFSIVIAIKGLSDFVQKNFK
jgi:hypothetical protein